MRNKQLKFSQLRHSLCQELNMQADDYNLFYFTTLYNFIEAFLLLDNEGLNLIINHQSFWKEWKRVWKRMDSDFLQNNLTKQTSAEDYLNHTRVMRSLRERDVVVLRSTANKILKTKSIHADKLRDETLKNLHEKVHYLTNKIEWLTQQIVALGSTSNVHKILVDQRLFCKIELDSARKNLLTGGLLI